jgi:hypothetical protein
MPIDLDTGCEQEIGIRFERIYVPHVELVGGSFTRNARWTAEVKSAKLVFDADQPCGSIEEIDSLSGGCRPA